MIFLYPASPSRIIVLFKTMRYIIENLMRIKEKKERSFRENQKKGIIFRSNAIKKRAQKAFHVLQRLWSKLNEINYTKQGKKCFIYRL